MTPATDCPACPACGLPCGTIDENELLEDWLVCGACGEEWEGSRAELDQARRADAAYAELCEAEQADAATLALMPESLREANRRMLARAVRPALHGEQLELVAAVASALDTPAEL